LGTSTSSIALFPRLISSEGIPLVWLPERKHHLSTSYYFAYNF
jgi:hypothetical protein